MFFRKKRPLPETIPETESYIVYFPLYIRVYKPGFDEESGEEPEELTGAAAYAYLEEEVREALCEDFAYSKLHQYFTPSGIAYGFTMEITEDGAVRITANVIKGISEEMKEQVRRFLEGQMSDGWGEDSDRYFRDGNEDGESYEVFFWKYENQA